MPYPTPLVVPARILLGKKIQPEGIALGLILSVGMSSLDFRSHDIENIISIMGDVGPVYP